MDITAIRAAIGKNRGGWENATDEEILRLWDLLGETLQQAYSKSLEPAAETTPEA